MSHLRRHYPIEPKEKLIGTRLSLSFQAFSLDDDFSTRGHTAELTCQFNLFCRRCFFGLGNNLGGLAFAGAKSAKFALAFGACGHG